MTLAGASPDPDFGDGPLDASKAPLVDVLKDVGVKSLKYLYDFGDGWQHTRSASSASLIPCPAPPTRVFSKQPDAARQRMSAGPGVTASSSMRSLTRTTRSTHRGCMDRSPIRSKRRRRRGRSGRAQPRQNVGPQTISPQAHLIRGLRRRVTEIMTTI